MLLWISGVLCLSSTRRISLEAQFYRVFNATSSWESFQQGIFENQSVWKQNQFPEKWSSAIARRTLNAILAHDKLKDKPPPLQRETHRKRISFFVQYRGTISGQLVQRLKKAADIDTFLTTRKLRTCSPSLKGPISTFMRSKVVYQMTCSRCQSTYVGRNYPTFDNEDHGTWRGNQHYSRSAFIAMRWLERWLEGPGFLSQRI